MTWFENVGVFIGERFGSRMEENIQHSEHGESLKSRKVNLSPSTSWKYM